jgi:hypothetical protein
MAGILDMLPDAKKFSIQKPEGPFAGPLVMSEQAKEPSRINELLSQLGDQDRFDALQEIRKVDRQKFSPEYIYKKDYKKNPYSFFGDGYDANVDFEINPEAIEQEFSDFLNVIEDPNNLDSIFGSGTLSPFAEDMLPELGRYREQHQALPSSFKDFIMNRYTGKS